MIDDFLADETVALVERWLVEASAVETSDDRDRTEPLQALIEDPQGVAFTMQFVDRVARPDEDAVAARQLRAIVGGDRLPTFLSRLDRFLLRGGAILAPLLPRLVMPLARRRIRRLVGNFVVDADPQALAQHLRQHRDTGFAQNVNLLGEAVLGEREADRRLRATMALLDQPQIDYLSIKVSAVASQLNYWDWEGSLERVVERLRVLFARAERTSPPTFINLDMEEYHDLDLTVAAFIRLLSEEAFTTVDAGIVLQAYLPDSFAKLRELVEWATTRHQAGGGEIKIRLVKGANLAMERVDAAIHGWEQAPYGSKGEVDANYKRCLDWVLTPQRTAAVRIGVASHNLFDVAWAHLVSRQREVVHRVDFEMLQGMAPAQSRVVNSAVEGRELLLYTPIVAVEDFDVAISYLFRRLEETSVEGNFMRVLFSLQPGTAQFAREADAFRVALADRSAVPSRPRRSQPRPASAALASGGEDFINEPDTDPALATNRAWAKAVVATRPEPVSAPLFDSPGPVGRAVSVARDAGWSETPAATRRRILHGVADELARRRGDLISAMVHEARKTFAQADPEVSEAIDFARFYGDRAVDLDGVAGARFSPLGVVAVIPPWNFPVAIPAGGVMAALAAGNAVILKPSSQTPRCAEIVAECAWEGGVPTDALQLVRTRGRDVGRHLVTTVDGVILTGSVETAQMFQSWKPDLKLFAETSGKNSMIITPHADVDLAVADLVASAFGHVGQKCSAASLAICVGDVYSSPRFRRQLVDAVESLEVGPAWAMGTTVGPMIRPADAKLERGLRHLDDEESWLVPPEQLDDQGDMWRPGVRIGVEPGSWFHRTECFGPVLGIMAAATLDEAIDIQNAGEYGLTGGIHTLDPTEADTWLEQVEVGNAYINRAITGAIVRRQPFGGWKRSSIGPGAKAGGPNYVTQLGIWQPDVNGDLTEVGKVSDARWWEAEFGREHDPSNLFCEANIFRYRPIGGVVIRLGPGGTRSELSRARAAARQCGVPTTISVVADEDDAAFAARLGELGAERVRVIGEVSDVVRVSAARENIHIADVPVTSNGRLELLHYLREQSVSRTLHRFGNLVASGA